MILKTMMVKILIFGVNVNKNLQVFKVKK